MHIRLLIILLLTAATCHGQSLLKTPVTPSRQNGTAGQFLDELNSVPGVTISYSSAIVDLKKNIKLSGQEKTVEDVLKVICNNQPIKYVEQNGKIFLVTTEPSKKKYTVSGYISDKQSGERLIGASVFITDQQTGTTSNTYGFFSITLDQDTVDLQISYAGYFTWQSRLGLHADLALQIGLEKNIVLNEMVVVHAAGKKNTVSRTIMGKTEISPDFIQSVPAILNEPDVMKSLQLLPGIQAGNEGFAGINVRGGSADQNLMLLDGVPVYNASHAFGLFSIFNASVVNNVEVLKGGFPASYGGRLSSVVDVHMKEGDKYNFHGEGGLGLIFSKLTFEGPIKKGSSSFLVSARRTYADLLIWPFEKISDGDERTTPFFTDLNIKANFPVGKKEDRMYVSLYMGKDKLRGRGSSGYRSTVNGVVVRNHNHLFDNEVSWGNTTAMMRWNHAFNKKTFANFTFSFSRYRFYTNYFEDEIEVDQPFIYQTRSEYHSSIRDWSMKVDIDYLPHPDHFIKTGITTTLHRYNPGKSSYYRNDNGSHIFKNISQPTLAAGEHDLYIEDDIRLSPNMKTNIGLRLSAFTVEGKLFTSLQPRMNWLYNLQNGWSLKASYGKMNQFIHLLTNNSLGMPTDLWVPVTKKLPPQTSHQVAAGTSWNYDQSLTVSMEVYYKSLKNVLDYSKSSIFLNAYDNWEDMVETGTGKSYGMEWLVRKRKGKISFLGSYTLSRSTRQFTNLNDGQAFPFKYDRLHEIKTALVWQKSKRFEASAVWLFNSGYAISIPVARYYDPFSSLPIDVFESRNNFRMPNYHRLDISFKFIKQKRKYLRTWVLSIYNAYNRLNPFYLSEKDSPDENKRVYKGVTIFPVLPSLSYQFKF